MKPNLPPPQPVLPIFNVQRPTVLRDGIRLVGRRLRMEGAGFVLLILCLPSLFAQSATGPLPPLAPAYGLIPPTFWEQHGTVVLIAGFAFLIVAGAMVWLLLRPKPPVCVPPEILAREALVRLRRQPETGKTLSEISHALHRYLIAVLGLPPGESTTAEFCAALMVNEKIGPDMARAAGSFLRECDQRKFSPLSPPAPLNAAERALAIVSELEKQRAPTGVQN